MTRPPLSVLHVISSLDEAHGGPTLALKHLALAQKRHGMRVAVAMTWRHGEDPSVTTLLRTNDIEVVAIGPCRGKLMWYPSTGRIVGSAVVNADVVHVHGLWEDVLHHAARASRQQGRPYVMRPCGMLDPWSLSRNYWLKRLFFAWRVATDLNDADAIHFTSELERDSAAALRLTAPAVIEGNGIDLELFRTLPPPGAFRSTLPFGDRGVILFLGRIAEKKGLDLLLQALAHPQCAGVNLAVVGPDEQPFRHRIDRMIDELGIHDRVFFAGMLRGRAVVEALVDAELTVLPSRQENFATSVLESLAAGTPVIVSDQVDIHPDITREAMGAVIPLEAQTLAATIAAWMSDADRRRTAGARGRAFGLQRNWDRIADHWAAHYARLRSRPREEPGRAGVAPVSFTS